MNYPSVKKTASLKTIFGKIRSTGVPEKFTASHLKSLGFTSSNDKPMLGALKFIGFLTPSSEPTEQYKNYRGKDYGLVLGQAIRSSYSELFQVYPSANAIDDESLSHFFATRTNSGEQVIKTTVRTFKTLCGLAVFDDAPLLDEGERLVESAEEPTLNIKKMVNKTNIPAVNINIELQIPATNDPEVYNNFFKALKDNLY